MTLAYSISGVAVNHIEDWNPSYSFHERPVDLGALPVGDYPQMQQFVVEKLEIDPEIVRGHFMEAESEFRVFLADAQEVRVDPRDGRGVFKEIKTRPGLYEVNVLHLNHIKGLWTWIADLFALLLIFLSLSGIFMMKGSRGLYARGKWFVAIGFVLPLAFVWYALS